MKINDSWYFFLIGTEKVLRCKLKIFFLRGIRVFCKEGNFIDNYLKIYYNFDLAKG
jgi:hypothetical protein